MRTGLGGIELTKRFEGFRAEPYICPAGVPTIGYGATYYPGGRKVTMSDDAITEEEATQLLANMLGVYEEPVNDSVTSDINQNQFDALVSFAYNLGAGAFKSSTLLKKVNADPCDPSIAFEFSRWVKAGGRVLQGLVKRRDAETELYFS